VTRLVTLPKRASMRHAVGSICDRHRVRQAALSRASADRSG
jgi:hypothetical protein